MADEMMVKIIREKSIKDYIKEGVERDGWTVKSVKLDIDKGFDGGNPGEYQPSSVSATIEVEEVKEDIWTSTVPGKIGWYGIWFYQAKCPTIGYFNGAIFEAEGQHYGVTAIEKFTRKSVQPW